MKKYIQLMLIAVLLTLASCSPMEEDTGGISETEENKTEETVNNQDEDTVDKKDNAEDERKDIKDSKKKNLSDLTVHYIDAGQADATLFQLSDEQEDFTILYDTGDWNKIDVIQYLKKQNISDIDLVIVSHPHADHIGQLESIMKEFNVGEVWMSGDESSSGTFQDAVQAVVESNADYHEPRSGEQFEVGALEIVVLHPETLKDKNFNANSISLLFTYGNVSFLFTGDAEKREEIEMLNRFPKLKADILQLGHHGSDTSSDPIFLETVEPKVAIYSAGENNSYGHPNAEVLSTIENSGAKIFGTDVHGTIVVTTDGNEFSIKPEKEGKVTPGDYDEKKKASDNDKTKTNEEDLTKKSESDKANPKDCVNINEATKEELQRIIHIGPKRAEDITENRPYNSVDDLQRIKGIGPSRIADIKNEGLACTSH